MEQANCCEGCNSFIPDNTNSSDGCCRAFHLKRISNYKPIDFECLLDYDTTITKKLINSWLDGRYNKEDK